MPKRQKNKKNEDEDMRPPQATLADFITVKLPQSSKHKQPQAHSTGDTLKSVNIETPVFNTTDDIETFDMGNTVVKTDTNKTVYFICRTKKGGFPIKTESRSSGKKVTIIEHVNGDAKSLLQDLKMAFGTGGLIKEDCIELQGDFVAKLTKYFNEHKQLFRPYGSKI